MKIKEIYTEGSFSLWNEDVLLRFRESVHNTDVGEHLLFENTKVKVWSIRLAPNESLPFHRHTRNYNWTALTAGTAISHYETGRVVAVEYDKGDLSFYNHPEKGDFVHNLTNTGNEILEFITVEYK